VRIPQVERSGEDVVVAGVCAGIARTVAVDPTFVRLVFALLAFASGAGIVAYIGAWALLPDPNDLEPARRRRRIVGTVLLVWSAILALTGLGLSNSIVWPLLIVSAGGVLLRRESRTAGVALIVVGIIVFISHNSRGSATTLLAPGAVGVALIAIAGPWAWRAASDRARAEERADMAARVHDSVLQTLTLIQKDPTDARRLARRQERELRAWLYPTTATGTLADAVDAAAAEIEELHGVRVDVVHTGDAALDERTQALVLAAREAMANAARHSGAEEVSVFVEPDAVYVRDRGRGFDPDSVAADRRGLSESIRGRMERVGGSAKIVSTPGEGTEVELHL
jgi:signal transduction histidine kinase/phage shock protein PspC (stress-responsive transcriptional regulator)